MQLFLTSISFPAGVPSAEHSHYCSLDAAILFSRQALHTTCAIVERCAAQPHASHKEAFGHCLEKETGVTCSDVLKVCFSFILILNSFYCIIQCFDWLRVIRHFGV